MRPIFTTRGSKDHAYCQQTERDNSRRIKCLLDDALYDRTSGIGEPEPLRHEIPGTWSQRITKGHWFVCQLFDADLLLLQSYYHFEKS
ncbi:Txe/YoeB family addiction module toxin [Acidithrix ferrooxidans]|uniref:Txe/YoeB family addiction module toxin n=1 Tax=Acidithrix ferrooxidans TaxID=1280514 RepID=UPI0009E457FA